MSTRSTAPPDSAPSGSRERSVRTIERLAYLLDDRYRVPGTSLRFGIDSLLGLVPVAGDLGTAVVSAYMIGQARKLGVRRRTLGRMALNVIVDVVVGAIPVVGDVFDFGWKANRKNAELVLREVKGSSAGSQEERSSP